MKKTLMFGTLLAVGVALAQSSTITIGGYGGQDPPVVSDLIAKFVKPKVPNVEIKYTPIGDPYAGNLLNQLSAGTAPDVFYLPDDRAAGLIASGKVLPLNGLIDTTPFVSSLQNTYTVDGKVYGIVKDFNTLALFYNKDLFDQAKVAYPSASDDWNTYADKLEKVQKALGTGYYGGCTVNEYVRFIPFVASTGWQPFDAKGKTNLLDERFVEAFDFYIGLVKKGVTVLPRTISQDWGGACMKSGKVATAMEGAWMLGFLRDNAPNLQYGVAPIPRNPKTKNSGNVLLSVAWAINADTKNKDAAVKVLQGLTSVETQNFVLESGLALPSRKALQQNAYFKKTTPEAIANRVIFQNANTTSTKVLPFTAKTYGRDWFQPIDDAITSVMSGQATSQDALKKAQAAIDAVTK
jgi:multiple sugar transport system substrate-binding protein